MTTLTSKLTALAIATVTAGGVIAFGTTATVSASEATPATTETKAATSVLYTDPEVAAMRATLSAEKQAQFDELTSMRTLTTEQQLDLLNQQYAASHDISLKARWKLSVLKQIVVKGASLLGKKLSSKSVADFADFLFDWSGQIEDGVANGLVKYLGVNCTAAQWAAKAAVFIFL